MQPLRESLERLLEAHEPNPALIVDGLWNLIESNRAASLLWDGVDPELVEPPINMLRLGVHPGGLPRISSMTAACNAPLIHRLRRRSREDADPALAKLIADVESYLPGEPPAGAMHPHSLGVEVDQLTLGRRPRGRRRARMGDTGPRIRPGSSRGSPLSHRGAPSPSMSRPATGRQPSPSAHLLRFLIIACIA